AVVLQKVEDLHDAGYAIQLGEGAGFIEEAIAPIQEVLGELRRTRENGVAAFADCQFYGQVFLDRDVAVQDRVLRQVGRAEAGLAQYGTDRVIAQPRTRRKHPSDGARSAAGFSRLAHGLPHKSRATPLGFREEKVSSRLSRP